MNIFGRLFGSDKVIDAGISGLDKMFYTSEEKAEDKLRAASWKIKMLGAYEPFKVAQRLLALTFAIPYAIAWFTTFCVSFSRDVTAQEKLLSGDISQIVWTIIGFYFLGGIAESVARGKK